MVAERPIRPHTASCPHGPLWSSQECVVIDGTPTTTSFPIILWFLTEFSQPCCPLQGAHNLVVPYGVPASPTVAPGPCCPLWSTHVPRRAQTILLSPMKSP